MKKFIILLIVVLVFSTIIVYQKFLSPAKTDAEYYQLWYLKSLNEEMLCWDNVCGWSWQNKKDFKVPNSPIIMSGILQKKAPIFHLKRKLITVPKAKNIYSPIGSFIIGQKYIIFVVPTEYINSTSGKTETLNYTQYRVYSYNKETNNLKEIYLRPEPVWVSSLSPNENFVSLANGLGVTKTIYLVNVEESKSKASFVGDPDTFQWQDNNSYQISFQDKCDSTSTRIFNCSASQDSRSCDPFFQNRDKHLQQLIGKNSVSTSSGTEYVYIDPAGWDPVSHEQETLPYFLEKKGKYTGRYIIAQYIRCSSNSIVLEDKSTQPIEIHGILGSLNVKSFSPILKPEYPEMDYTNTLIGTASVMIRGTNYSWRLEYQGLTANPILKKEYDSAVEDFKAFLGSIRFNFKE